MSVVKNDLPLKELQAVAATVKQSVREAAFSAGAVVCFTLDGMLISESPDGKREKIGRSSAKWTTPAKRRLTIPAS